MGKYTKEINYSVYKMGIRNSVLKKDAQNEKGEEERVLRGLWVS